MGFKPLKFVLFEKFKLSNLWPNESLLSYFYMTLVVSEGNVNPLQCSCLENPRDGGAWWASVSGVAQSRT